MDGWIGLGLLITPSGTVEAVYWQVGVFSGGEIGSTDYDRTFPGSLARFYDGFPRASEHFVFIVSECLLKLTLFSDIKDIHEGKGVAHRPCGRVKKEITFNPTIARAFTGCYT